MQTTDLDLLAGGVGAVAQLVAAAQLDDAARANADASWTTFETNLVAARDTRLCQLVAKHGLDRFEVQCVVLALATHVEPKLTQLVADSGSSVFSRIVTVRLALDCFCRSLEERVRARRSFQPDGRLVRHQIVSTTKREVGAGDGLLARQIELTTPTVRHLLREEALSEDVARVARFDYPTVALTNVVLDPVQLRQVLELVSNHNSYRELITRWGFEKVLPYGRGLTLLFSGPPGTGKTLTAQGLAAAASKPMITLSATDLPEGEGLDKLLDELFAEAEMREAIVLLDECEALLGRADKRKATAFRAIEAFQGILILTTNNPENLDGALERRIIFHLPFEMPDSSRRAQIWEVHLPPEVPLEGDIDLGGLADRYDFTGGTIKNAVLFAVNRALARRKDAPVLTMELLEEGCRAQLRYALEKLTVRTTTHMRLVDLVLPEDPMRKVRELLAACRNQAIVLNRWGFGRRLVTGKGITALFDGPPGTGKTYTAEIVAGELDRPLYRINIPEVVSKYVGETEKHIKSIFQQAKISHAMLLFDEADSLFASRVTETKSSTDRYANMEVNLLLQEIERFPGIVILTTNFYGALDKALIRRIQFRVTFEDPTVPERLGIWKVLCPPEAPLAEDVDFQRLAEIYELTGGMIKNVLLRAAYLAADGEGVITQALLHASSRDEYRAAGKLARDVEIAARLK
ncbi:MAG: SpoVK/Ycf46/Vps4 family AAA+-type ATPase [Myxococcota bacterium]|jgi:SpoVK/Ycf46/Vps4 family AAA+-type ATPase